MKRMLALTLTALSLGACAVPPAAGGGPTMTTGAAIDSAADAFLPGRAFWHDAMLSAGPAAIIRLDPESADAARLRYERGTEETLEWPGSGHGEAVLLNGYGQQVWSVREGAAAQRVLVPAGLYRLVVRNLDTADVLVTRGSDGEAASLRLRRLAGAQEQAVSRAPGWAHLGGSRSPSPVGGAVIGIEAFLAPSVTLVEKNIQKIDLEGRAYQSLYLERCFLYEVNLDRVRLDQGWAGFSGSYLARVTMRSAAMKGANFAEATAASIDLSDASIPGANFRLANVNGSKMVRAHLPGAEMSGARLVGADMAEADLTGARFFRADMEAAKLKGAKLDGASFSDTYLAGADLSGASLRGADLRDADLSGADLTGADLEGAHIAFTKVKGLRINGIVVQDDVWKDRQGLEQAR